MFTTTLDLHGMTWNEAQASFIEFYNRAVIGMAGARLDVIHGYGSTGTGGVLRSRLRLFLARHEAFLQFQPGENIDGNQGHTLIIPIKPLPSLGEGLEMEILAYCATPRSQSKITGKFRRHGENEVLGTIKMLVKQQRLTASSRGGLKMYQAV